jgi:hypothetical protein
MCNAPGSGWGLRRTIMQTNTFRLVTTGSIIGLIGTVLLTTSKATSDHFSWWDTQREKTEAENAKAIADAYQENQIAYFNQLIVSNYTLNNSPPQLDWQHIVNPNEKTIIYDRYRKCIGYAYQGQFKFILYYKGVCD